MLSLTGNGNLIAKTPPKPDDRIRFQGSNAPGSSHPVGISGKGSLTGAVASAAETFFLNTSKPGWQSIVLPESAVLTGRSIAAQKRDGWLELQERLFEEILAAMVWLKGVDFLTNVFKKGMKKGLPQYQHLSSDIAWNRLSKKPTHVDLTPQEMFAKNQGEMNTLLKIKSVRWLFSVGLALASVGYFIPKLNQLKTNFLIKQLGKRKRQTEGSNVQFGDPLSRRGTAATGQTRFNHAGPSPYNRLDNRPGAPNHQTIPNPTNSAAQSFNLPASATANFSANKPFAFSAPSLPSNARSFRSNASGFPLSPQVFPALNASTPPHPSSTAPRFRGIPGGSLVQGLGHMVEQTPYGSILVVDFGIAGGRGFVASKRSPFETAEVIVRDLGSLYFYIWAAPHLMKLMSMGLGAPILLQPKIAQAFNKRVLAAAQEQGLHSPAGLNRVIEGTSANLAYFEGPLAHEMRGADRRRFVDLFRKEAKVYLKGSAQAETIAASLANQAEPLTPARIQKLLKQIQEAHKPFAALSTEQRQNLAVALKQAFRHTVGLNLSVGLERHPEFSSLFGRLRQECSAEAGSLSARVSRMAELDGLDQVHSILRRSFNVARDLMKSELDSGSLKSHVLLEQGENLANFVNKALNRRVSLKEQFESELQTFSDALSQSSLPNTIKNHLSPKATLDQLIALEKALASETSRKSRKLLSQLKPLTGLLSHSRGNVTSRDWQTLLGDEINQLMAKLKSATHQASEQELLSHYQQEIQELLSGKQKRLFSLAIEGHDVTLRQKLAEMLKGGLRHDSAFLSEALEIVSQLETDSRKFIDLKKASQMRENIGHYADGLMEKAEKTAIASGMKPDLQDLIKQFYKRTRNMHYATRIVALSGTMLCLGWLVPMLQTTLTKRLTGRDKNPGIAFAISSHEKAHALESKLSNSLKSALPASWTNTFTQAHQQINKQAFGKVADPSNDFSGGNDQPRQLSWQNEFQL